jgi:hypothetical protein
MQSSHPGLQKQQPPCSRSSSALPKQSPFRRPLQNYPIPSSSQPYKPFPLATSLQTPRPLSRARPSPFAADLPTPHTSHKHSRVKEHFSHNLSDKLLFRLGAGRMDCRGRIRGWALWRARRCGSRFRSDTSPMIVLRGGCLGGVGGWRG